MKEIKVRLGMDVVDALLIDDTKEKTVQVELLYDMTEGEDVPLDSRRTGVVIKRHRHKHLVEGK